MVRQFWLIATQLITIALAVCGVYYLWTKVSSPGTSGETSAISAFDMSHAAQTAFPSVVTILTRSRTNHPLSEVADATTGLINEHSFDTLGSGVIVSADGYILTNQHVVNGIPELIVQLSDGQRFNASILNSDKDTDLAVLKVLASNLAAIEMAPTEQLKVGQPVLAIGNPFAVGQTVTAGIISALGRHGFGLNNYEDFIQTDAAINQGNSGGALVDAEGKLVGINTAIFSPDTSESFIGIGFAIPVSMIQKVLPGLMSGNRLERGYLGVVPVQLTPEYARDLGLEVASGVMINSVIQGSPAARAGLRAFDVITRIGENNVYQVTSFLDLIATLPPNTDVNVTVLRGKETLNFVIRIRPRPENPLKQNADEAVTNVA